MVELSVPQAHSVEHDVFLLTLEVALEELLLASAAAAAPSAAEVTTAQPPVAGLVLGEKVPLAGWIGHAAPFEFKPGYRPAATTCCCPISACPTRMAIR